MSVTIEKVQQTFYDFRYNFRFDHRMDFERAHDRLRNHGVTRYTRYVGLTVPSVPREKFPDSWAVWVGRNNYPYPYVMLISNRGSGSKIDFRGFLTYEESNIYAIVAKFLKPLVDERLISQKDYEEILEYFAPKKEGLKVNDRGMIFILMREWGRKMEVTAPGEWPESEYGTPLGDENYRVKLWAMRLLEKAKVVIFDLKVMGYRWVNLTDDEMKARADAGKKSLVVDRRMIKDTNNMIHVRHGRSNTYSVDVSRYPGVPERLNLADIMANLSRVAQTTGKPYVDSIEEI